MKINLSEALLKSINNDSHPKKLHRYSCSNIYALLKGWEDPKTYLEPKLFDFQNAYRMWQGKWKHQQIQSLLEEYDQEIKVEKEVDGMTIVGMADLINETEVIEIKTSEKLHDKAKAWQSHQLRLYLTLFERPTGRVVQPIRTKSGLFLKELGTYKRNDTWFEGQMSLLKEKDKLITEYYETRKEGKT